MQKTTIFFILSLSICLVTVSVNSLVTNYAVREHSKMIKNLTSQVESLQERIPAKVHVDGFEPQSIIKAIATTTQPGKLYFYNTLRINGEDFVSTYRSRKKLCQNLGGTYNTNFNTTYEEAVGNFKVLQKEYPTYECSRVEPVYLGN